MYNESSLYCITIIMHLSRGNGATERELEALAIYMGHSMEMQRGTYDRHDS